MAHPQLTTDAAPLATVVLSQPNGMTYGYAFDTDGSKFTFSAEHPDGWDIVIGDDDHLSIDAPVLDTLLSLTTEGFTTLRALLNSPELEAAFTAAREWFAPESEAA